MQEAIAQMRNDGLLVDYLVMDGKIHRCKVSDSDKGTPGWYIGHVNYARISGAQFNVIVYGNYRTGLENKWQTDMKIDPEDRKAFNDSIQKCKIAADDERRRVQIEVSEEVSKMWDSFSPTGSVPYLDAKKITHLFGARCEYTQNGALLWIPLRDIEGKIWSLQSIPSDYKGKRFYPGGRIQGCFHLIGDSSKSDIMIVCEGFATGCSIHMATDLPVIVSFQATNLTSVAQVFKEKFPDKVFVIAGDDDQWTKKPDGTPWNPGREAAEDAAKKIMGIAVYPRFRSPEEGRTTDFNDLHCYEGIEKVKEQILHAKPTKHYIVPLGYDNSNYYLLSNVNPQIQCMPHSTLGTSTGLCRLQPLVYWKNLFPAKNGEGVAWQDAADHIMMLCHRKGIFKPDRVRGRGVWTDDHKIVYHMGDRLWIEGNEMPLHRNQLQSKYIYESAESLPPVHSDPLTVEECKKLVRASLYIRWKKDDYFKLFAGWLAIAPVSGSLSWRPHVWITGPSGSGKSYVLQSIVHPLLSDYAQYFRGQTTEAGIRQKSGRSTMPVIFDEFETNDDKSGDRIKSILELARQASSDSDGIVAKGSISGDATEFRPQFSMLCASVRINLIHEEDENRFTVLDIARGKSGTQQFEYLQGAVAELGREYGRRLFARSLRLAFEIKTSTAIIQNIIAQRFPMRIAQQYGALIAGFWSLCSDEAITEEKAKELVDTYSFEYAQASAQRNDEMECLDYLFDKVIKTESGGKMVEGSLRELTRLAKENPTQGYGLPYIDAIQRYGIDKKDGRIIIDVGNRTVAGFYVGSKWSGNYKKQILRLDDVTEIDISNFKVTGGRKRCLSVPLHLVLPDDVPPGPSPIETDS